jgi:hypothetical protein
MTTTSLKPHQRAPSALPQPVSLSRALGPSFLGCVCLLAALFPPPFACEVSAQEVGYVRSLTSSGVPTKWHSSCVPIYLNPAGREALAVVDIERVMQRSIQAWGEPSCALLSVVYEGESAQNELGYLPSLGTENKNIISFISPSQGDRWLYDRGALALTTVTFCQNDSPECPAGTIVDADIEVNMDNYSFSTGSAEGIIDLENTLTHELGHLIGFDHSPYYESTMFAVSPPGDLSKRDLAPVDIEGLCEVYPADDCLECNLNSYDFSVTHEALASCFEGGRSNGAAEGSAQELEPVNCAQGDAWGSSALCLALLGLFLSAFHRASARLSLFSRLAQRKRRG